jgi:hypothetical protein
MRKRFDRTLTELTKPKYRNRVIETAEGRFHSKGEYARWCELCRQALNGEIADLRRQVRFNLILDGAPILIRSPGFPNGRTASYTADFVYTRDGATIVEDFKGHDTAEARLRRAVFERCTGIPVLVTFRPGKAAA